MNKMKAIKRSLVGILALVLGSTLLSGPAQAVSPLVISDIYNPLKVLKVELSLPASSVTSLNNPTTFKIYVPATLNMSVSGRSSGNLDVTVRLKGSTSIYSLDETPSFKIKFKKGANGLGYLGLRRLTLNAMVQDSSKIHEYGAYTLFNAMGLPASKTGWAHTFINGKDRGLFVNVEQPDQIFISKRFKDITQHVYEGTSRKDLQFGNDDGIADTGAFLADYGWKTTPNKNDLTKLINYANDWDPKSRHDNLPQVIDRTGLIKFMAVENFLGHWDGYSGSNINNYFLRSNTRNVFTIIPWGTDQTFGENRFTEKLGDSFYLPLISETVQYGWTSTGSRGRLYTQCINYKPCRTEYLLNLKAVSAMATKIKLGTKMRQVATVIEPVLAAQYKTRPSLLTLAHSEQTRSIGFLTTRHAEVKKLLLQYKIK